MNIIPLALLLAVAPQQKPAAAGPDLSTPEQTVRSFVKALFSGRIKSAMMCVSGVAIDPRLDAMEADIQKQNGGKEDPNALKIETTSAEVNGDSATVTAKYAGLKEPGMQSEEKIPLKHEAAGWKIVPLPKAEVRELQKALDSKQPGASAPPVRLMASMISDTETLFRARQAALTTSCLSNIKQVSIGALMFLQDYDEKFKLQAATYRSKLMPYIKNERIFHCPSDPTQGVSYSFNANLQGIAMAKIKSPAKTVMIYEGKAGKLDFRHDGRASVGFADGHAKLVNKQEAASLRWMP